jgi:hypothetical protein
LVISKPLSRRHRAIKRSDIGETIDGNCNGFSARLSSLATGFSVSRFSFHVELWLWLCIALGFPRPTTLKFRRCGLHFRSRQLFDRRLGFWFWLHCVSSLLSGPFTPRLGYRLCFFGLKLFGLHSTFRLVRRSASLKFVCLGFNISFNHRR